MAYITITSKSYSFKFPPIIDEDLFWVLKQELPFEDKDYLLPKLDYWKEFKFEAILICSGAISIYFAADNGSSDILGLLGLLLGLSALICFIGLISSVYSYIENYHEQRNYFTSLKDSVAGSVDYSSFCKRFSNNDFRYYKLIG